MLTSVAELNARFLGSGIVLCSWSAIRDCEEGMRLCGRGLRLPVSRATATSEALVEEPDFAGDLDRAEIAERDRRWPKEWRGEGLGLRCCDQAATWMKLRAPMLVSTQVRVVAGHEGGMGIVKSRLLGGAII